MVVIEKGKTLLMAGFARFVEELALAHQVIAGGEPAHGVDDVSVAQGAVVVEDGGQVGFLKGEDVGAHHLGAETVEGGFQLGGVHPESAARVGDGVVVADLNIFVAKLCHLFHRGDGSLCHFLPDGIEDQSDFQHILTTPYGFSVVPA